MLGAVIALTEQVEAYDEQIERIARERYPETARLEEVPGVGTLTAVSFMLTIAEPQRFSRSREVGGYVGLRPRQQQSGARNPQLGITKAGDRYLRKLLVQSAHCVLRRYAPDTALKRWGLKLCERGGTNAKKRAVVAVARKLAVLLHKLWVSETRYVAFPAAA
jgi:transposase